MTSSRQRWELPVRLAAGAATVLALAVCHGLAVMPDRPMSGAMVFFVVVCVCGSFAIFARALGGGIGAGLGLAAGLSASIGLTNQIAAPLANQIAFTIVATGVLGLLGFLAGSWSELNPAGQTERAGRATVRLANAASLRPRAHETYAPSLDSKPNHPAGLSAEEAIGEMISDFCAWVQTDHVDRVSASAPLWPAFDQFVRQVLREKFGASGVRVFRVLPNGDELRPITKGSTGPTVPAREGLVGHVVTSGQVYVADDPDQGVLIDQLAEADCDADDEHERRWSWLLPLRERNHCAALVAVGRVERPGFGGASMAGVVRDCLQLFWTHLRDVETLKCCHCTDRQSGMLNRTELLNQVRQAAEASTRAGEPLMILALSIEGLRGLDDSGRWSLRDDLIQRLGEVLRRHVRSDDLLGRFSDDRFAIVLRRLDSALGTLVTRKLMDAVRTEVLDLFPPSVTSGALRLRGGLAGSGLKSPNGNALLERALSLLDEARTRNRDLATDLEQATTAGPVSNRSTGGPVSDRSNDAPPGREASA